MMKRVFKYQLGVSDEQVVNLPIGSRILSLQVQRGIPCIWAIVDDQEVKTSPVKILMFGTGNHISDEDAGNRFAGTIQIRDLVFHVFLKYDYNSVEYLIV